MKECARTEQRTSTLRSVVLVEARHWYVAVCSLEHVFWALSFGKHTVCGIPNSRPASQLAVLQVLKNSERCHLGDRFAGTPTAAASVP